MAQTLADVRVAFKDETGVEYSCSFRDIDTLLYQWQQGLLNAGEGSIGAYISSQLNWNRPLTDFEIIGLSKSVDRIRKEFIEAKKSEFNEQVQRGQLSDSGITPGKLTQKDVHQILTPRFSEPPKADVPPLQFSGELGSTRLSPGEIVDIATVVLLVMRADIDLDAQWCGDFLQQAGVSPTVIRQILDSYATSKRR